MFDCLNQDEPVVLVLGVFLGGLGAHIRVCLQLSQETFPVFRVVIDSEVSRTVDVCQDPLSLLRDEFVFLYCKKKKKKNKRANIMNCNWTCAPTLHVIHPFIVIHTPREQQLSALPKDVNMD